MMLPAILDPCAAHAMFEAAHLAAQFSGRKVWLVSVAPPSTLAANAVRYLSVTPPKQQRHTQHWAHRRKHRVRRALCRCPGAKIYGVQGAEFAHPRYASDVAAAEAICRAASPQLVIAPATSLFLRVLPAVTHRLHGSVDTHITAVRSSTIRRLLSAGSIVSVWKPPSNATPVPGFCCSNPDVISRSGLPLGAHVQIIDVSFPDSSRRTTFAGVRIPSTATQTIRPDAKLLFVAAPVGARNNSMAVLMSPRPSPSSSIFLHSGAPLGGSKSLVDQSGENQAVLAFMTHLNHVGQAGSTPRRPKGQSLTQCPPGSNQQGKRRTYACEYLALVSL